MNQKKRNDVVALLDYAGSHRGLTFLGLGLSAVSLHLGARGFSWTWSGSGIHRWERLEEEWEDRLENGLEHRLEHLEDRLERLGDQWEEKWEQAEDRLEDRLDRWMDLF